MYVSLPKLPINQFKPVEHSRQLVLSSYCPNTLQYAVGKCLAWQKNAFFSFQYPILLLIRWKICFSYQSYNGNSLRKNSTAISFFPSGIFEEFWLNLVCWHFLNFLVATAIKWLWNSWRIPIIIPIKKSDDLHICSAYYN